MRAFDFLALHGVLFGLSEDERVNLRGKAHLTQLRAVKTSADKIGSTHVKFDQFYGGLKVFGAQLIVHMNERGITGVSGYFVPGIGLSLTPAHDASAVSEIALSAERKQSAAVPGFASSRRTFISIRWA